MVATDNSMTDNPIDTVYTVDGPVDMSIADRAMFRKASQHYPRYLFRTQHRNLLSTSGTGNVITPLGMLGMTQDKLWTRDLHQTSTRSLLQTIRRHATGMRVESVFTSWTHSLFCALHLAGQAQSLTSTDLCVLDTSTLRNPHIFHLTGQFMRDVVQYKNEEDGYPWEFLIHGEVSGFQKIDLSTCPEITSMWDPQTHYPFLEGEQAMLLENARTFALRFDREARFAMAVIYLGYVFIRQRHWNLAFSWDLTVNTTFIEVFKSTWNASNKLEASEFLDLDFADHLVPDIELTHHIYSHVRENVAHWPRSASTHIRLHIRRHE